MNMEKMKEIFSNEEFVKSLFAMETVAEVQAALKEKGLELTEEELMGIRAFFVKVEQGEISSEQLEHWVVQAESGELSEELLEQVSGGVLATILAAGVMVGAIAGGAGLTVGAIIGVKTAAEGIKGLVKSGW